MRFRLGNEMRERKYWMEERKRLCRISGWEEERWEHVLWWCRRGVEGLEKMKGTQERVKFWREMEQGRGEKTKGG